MLSRRWWLLPVIGLFVGALAGALVGLLERDGVDGAPATSTVTSTGLAENAPPSSAAPAQAGGLVVESGFSTGVDAVNNRFTSAGATVLNPTAQTACAVGVEFRLTDADGTQLELVPDVVELIPPGQTALVAPAQIGFNATAAPGGLSVVVVSVGSFVDPSVGCTASDDIEGVFVAVSGAALEREGVGGEVIGEVSNPSNRTIESPTLDCIYRRGGAIVGGESSGLGEPIEAGATVALDLSTPFAPDGVDAVECQLVA